MGSMKTVICDYCGKPTEYVDSSVVYHGRSYGMIYYCKACEAWVGVHRGSDKPMGRLANFELRVEKRKAHAVFDQIWRHKHMRRESAYAWLAEQLGLPRQETHIGMFDVDQCKRVVEICRKKLEEFRK